MFLSDARRREPVRFQNFRHRLHVFVRAESVNAVAVSILSVRMAMLSCENAGATHGARGTCTECVVKHNTAFGKCIDVRGSDDLIP